MTRLSSNRWKLWFSVNGTWVSGYNDNKFTATDISNISGNKIGDIMNIGGSNWNLFIDEMNTETKKERLK